MSSWLPAGSYLSILLLSLLGLYLIDKKYSLAFSRDKKRALLATLPAYLFLVIWDLLGISQGIFFEGENSLLVGLDLAPNFPIEEIFFLALLCYSTLIAFTLLARKPWRK